jgi:hypothetical protein
MLEKILTTEQFPIWANEFAQSVAGTYDPDCIILFGSVARNEHSSNSDVDILVIGGSLPDLHRERFRLLLQMRPRFAPLQVHDYSRSEWDQMMATKHVTALEALNDGIALYGHDMFLRWRREFERWLTLGLRRANSVWKLPVELRAEDVSTWSASS